MKKCNKHRWAMFGNVMACAVCGSRKGGLKPIDLNVLAKTKGKGKAKGTLTAKK